MRSKFQLVVVFVISALLFSCTEQAAETKVDMTKAKADIQALEDGYAAAEKAKNADSVAAYYSDDAISYNRNEEPTSGKAAIRDRIAKNIAKDTSGNVNVYKVVDLFGEGNTLVEVGSWTVVTPEGKEVDKGHYMSVFQKRDGKYVCVRDMNVSSTAAKP